MNILRISIILLFISGCSGLSVKDQATVDLLYVETLGAVVDNNPQYKPMLLDLANEAKAALASHTAITKGGASQWLVNHLTNRFANDSTNPRIKRLLLVVLATYMPDWENSTLSFLSQADIDNLNHAIDETILALQ